MTKRPTSPLVTEYPTRSRLLPRALYPFFYPLDEPHTRRELRVRRVAASALLGSTLLILLSMIPLAISLVTSHPTSPPLWWTLGIIASVMCAAIAGITVIMIDGRRDKRKYDRILNEAMIDIDQRLIGIRQRREEFESARRLWQSEEG